LLGTALCGLFFAPSDSHHVRRHLEKSRREKSCAAKSMVKMRGVFFAPSDFPPRPQASGKSRRENRENAREIPHPISDPVFPDPVFPHRK
jgi:hypothetical protein